MNKAELLLTPESMVPKQDRKIFLIGAGLLIAFLFGLWVAPYVKRARGPLPGEVSQLLPPLDPDMVEPLVFKPVARDVAEAANAAVPVTDKPVPAAAPFIFFGKDEEKQRAIDCLAATIYYEAGAEAVTGQIAVAQVVLNRMRHPAYPKTICGVVFQGHERRTGCQFSYTCDGSMVRRRPSPAAWSSAQRLATAMVNGMVYAPVGTATHYHTDWVLPAWSAKLEKVRVERTHLFFRYLGFWGTTKAFVGRHQGVEPRFGKLGLLSPQHRNADTNVLIEEVQALDEAPAGDEPAAPAEQVDPQMGGFLSADAGNQDILKLQIDPLLDGDTLPKLAIRACGDRKNCKVNAWADANMMPDGDVIDHNARAAIAFSFERNRSGKGSNAKWNCALFPRENKGECL